VWVLLPVAPDWRWLLEREDCPWYPTMRLFRQTEPGHWEPVFERIAREARQLQAVTTRTRPIRVEVPPGELLDKITILEIKSERFADAAQLRAVRAELAALEAVRAQALPQPEALTGLTAEPKAVNEASWQAKDEIRQCERDQDFGPHFIELARRLCRTRDCRAVLKRQIDDLLSAPVTRAKV
jgi:hypothetical protein